MIALHRPLALETLTSTVCLAALVGAFASAPPPSALREAGDDRSSLGSVVQSEHAAHAAYAAYGAAAFMADAVRAVHASTGHIFVPMLSKGHPLAVCRGGMDEAAAVERARGASCMMGICGQSGEGDAEVIAALRMTAEEHDVRYPEDGPLLEDVFPVGPPWVCYWRIELRGDGVPRAGPPGSGPIRINRSMELFPAETCDDCLGGMASYWWEDEGTPGVEATSTALPEVPEVPTLTPSGTRPSATASATARVWPSPTP